MNGLSRAYGILCAVAAFGCCLGAGCWLLSLSKERADLGAIGVYFIGKAFFVPSLGLLLSRDKS